jgi:hypothetical protein
MAETTSKVWREAYDQAYSVWDEWLREARRDIKFYVGDQWRKAEKHYLKNQRRQILSFNKIRRVIHLVEGYERKNRLAIKVDPQEGLDAQVASQLSGALQYVFQQSGAYEIMSDCFSHGTLKSGFNLLELSLDYGDDPVDGDVKYIRNGYNSFLVDPNMVERDLSDCRYILRRKWVTKDEAKAILKGHDKEIEDISTIGTDSRFTYNLPAKDLYGKDLGRLDEIFQRTRVKKYWVLDQLSGKKHRWPGSKYQLDEALREPSPNMGINYGQFMKPLPYWADAMQQTILFEEQVFYDGEDVLGIDDYPFIANMGFWEPEYHKAEWKLQGLVRCMRDPQTEVNRRRSKMIDIIDSVISTGKKIKADSLVDPASAYHTGQGAVMWLKKTASMDDVQELQGANVPQGLFQSIELFDKDIMEIPGATAELMGSPENDNIQVAGILAKLRQSAGLTILQNLFDFHRHCKKQLGKKTLQVILKNWSPEKLQAILGEEPKQEIFSQQTLKYDVVPVEGLLTDTQRQMYYAQLMAFKQAGAPVPWSEILEASPIEFKDRLMEAIKQAEQGQAQQAQQAAQSQQATDELVKAEAQARIAKAKGETAKIEKDFASAGLDRAKTMAEIQGMTFDRLLELVKTALTIETAQQSQQAQIMGAGPPQQGQLQGPPQQQGMVPMRRDQMITRR